MDLSSNIEHQIILIEEGKTLEAFYLFSSENICMYHNNELFASSKMEALKSQNLFMQSVTNFKAKKYYCNLEETISILGINYSFKDKEDIHIDFRGIHIQKWENNLIIKEEFFTGKFLEQFKLV